MKLKKLRVLEVMTHFDLGGAESVAISLGEALSDRIDFAFLSVFEGGETAIGRSMRARLDARGIAQHHGTRIGFKRGGLVPAGVRLARLVDAVRPDVVHLHTELPEAAWSVASLVSRRVRQTPLLRTIHNTRLWPSWRAFGLWSERRLQAGRVVAVSEGALAAVQNLREQAGLPRLDQARASIVLNGVSVPSGVHRGSDPHGPSRVLFAGRLEAQKGADLLPQIWSSAKATATRPMRLTVLGEGTLKAELTAAFAGDRSVEFLPPVPALSRALLNYDVLLVPSRFEGLPLVAVEALMAGLSVVAFDAPGLREVFPTGYPLLVPEGDVAAFAQIVSSVLGGATEGVAVAAASVRARFSIDRMAEDYARLFQDVALTGESVERRAS